MAEYSPNKIAIHGTPARSNYWESRVVWLVWIVMAFFAVGIFLHYSSAVPFGDDWFEFTPIQSGHPIDWSFFWTQYSENHFPLTKLLLVLILKLPGNSIRNIIFYNVLVDVALPAAFILALRRIRGRVVWTDAFLPLIWLHPAHMPAFTWASVATMVTSNLLSAIMLLVVMVSKERLSPVGGLIGGLCLVGLPWCGGQGILAAVVLGCWFLPLSFLQLKRNLADGCTETISYVHFTLGIIAITLIPLYFVGYRAIDGTPASPGVWASAVTALEYLATGFAPGSRVAWIFASAVTVCLVIVSIAILHAKYRERVPEWPQLLGLTACMAVGLILALAVGVKRAGCGPGSGYTIRYAEYGSLSLTTLYVICTLYAPERMRALPGAFVALILVFMPVLIKNGFAIAETSRLTASRFEYDANRGATFAVIASRYATSLQMPVDDLKEELAGLRLAKVAPFERIQADPATVENRISPIPYKFKYCVWSNGGARTTGRASCLIFKLPRTAFVTAIRIKYVHRNDLHSQASFEAYWKRTDQVEFTKHDWPSEQHYYYPFLATGLNQHTTTIYINDTVDELCISPDRVPCWFQVSDITVLALAAKGKEPMGAVGR